MDSPMPDDPALPLDRAILKLRALCVPAGAADQASVAGVARALGHGAVKVPAIFVPEGEAPPGHAYVDSVLAVFRPDEGDGVGQPYTNSRTARPTEPAQGEGTPVVPPSPALALVQGDPLTAGAQAQHEPEWISGPPPHALAPDAGYRTSLTQLPGGDRPTDVATQAHPMQSTRSDVSYNSAPRLLDTYRDAVDAAVRALDVAPAYTNYSQIGDGANVTNWPGSPSSKLQQPPDDLSEAGASHANHILADGPAPTQFVQGPAPKPPGNVGRASNSSEQGVAVLLPNGLTVPDAYSVTGHMMSPVIDLAPVAAAGRRTGQMYQTMLSSPEGSGGALPYLATTVLTNIGQGGVYDYQRQGNHLTGFAQLRQYRDVSNFNVGLFCQQAGLPLEEVLGAAGRYARIFSGNAKPDQPYGLDSRTADFIKSGYAVGQSGVFGSREAQE
jgi:hypothetical protein